MKTLLLSILAWCLSATLQAQTNAVRFYGSNTNSFTTGIPYYWIAEIRLTNQAPDGTFVLMSQTDIVNTISTNQAAYNNWASNFQFSVDSSTSSNFNAWLSLYQQIPLGMNDTSNRMIALTNIYSGWLTGTNSVGISTGGSNAIVQVIKQDYYFAVYFNQLLEYLSRLGPGLQQIYRPASDPIGH